MKRRWIVRLELDAPLSWDETALRWHVERMVGLSVTLADRCASIEVEMEPEEPSLSVEDRQ